MECTGRVENARKLRQIAEGVAREAGDYLRGVFRTSMDVSAKEDQHDLVTEHDEACERLIVAKLTAATPDASIVAEESGERQGSPQLVWHIDPIDGTTNFAQGYAFFAVSIAAELDGELVAGAVYDPMADQMFAADLEGAYLNGNVLTTPPTLPPGQATLITGFPTARDLRNYGESALADFGELVREFSSVRRTGCGALSLCYVAAGWVDSTFGAYTSPWDVAAGIQVVRRAGSVYQPIWVGHPRERAGDHFAVAYYAHGPGHTYPPLSRLEEKLSESYT